MVLLFLPAAASLAAAGGCRSPATAPSWACGQLVEPQLGWTSAGFTKPLRLVLESVLRPSREISVTVRGGVVREVHYAGHVPHLFDTHVFRPITRAGLVGARQARRLQSGSLTAYVAYLVGLVLVLLIAVRIGLIA